MFKDIDLNEKNDIYASSTVKSSISNILGIPKGNILGIPEFGLGLNQVFGQNDTITISLLQRDIETEISRWDSRLTVNSIDINQEGNSLYISINMDVNNAETDETTTETVETEITLT